MDNPSPAEPLAYAVNDQDLQAQWQREKRFPWLPSIGVSLVTLLLFDTLYLLSEAQILLNGFHDLADNFWAYWTFPICAAFLPLFVKRRGWLRLVVCVPLCSAVFLLFKPMDAAAHPLDQNFWYAIICAVTAALVAFCWHASTRLGWIGFIFATLPLAAFLGLISLTLLDLDYFLPTHWEWTLAPGDSEIIDAFILRYVLLALLWLALAMLASRGLHHLRVAGFLAAILAAATVSFLVFAYLNTIRPLMIVRLMPQAPESQQLRDYSYLVSHGISDDDLLSILEKTSWNGSWTAFPAGTPHLPGERDWRLQALDRLPRNGPTAGRLASILLAQPRLALAQAIAARLGESRAYAAAPILLQFSLFNRDESCIHALEMMSLPHVSWALLYQASPLNAKTDPRLRDQLPAVFGVDLPPGGNWVTLINAKGHGRRPPIPDAVCDQADLILKQYQRYLDVTEALLTHLGFYPASAIVSMDPPRADAIYVPQGRLSACIAANIKEPLTDEATLAALTAEVDRYVADVDHFLHPAAATTKKR